ncbi:MAG: biopolymer transporter ExbD [Lentisphaeria bacterium]|nr:biopolymer transporter ExbD [Lentisphaeria bacterium]
MGRFSEAGHGYLRSVHEINVTPLMDLTFMLLIVFMITAPVLEYETDVSLPEWKTTKPIDEERQPLLVTINRSGEILFQKQVVTAASLQQRLEFLRQERPDIAAVIRADEERPYKEIVEVMRAVRQAGIRQIKLATQPEDRD